MVGTDGSRDLAAPVGGPAAQAVGPDPRTLLAEPLFALSVQGALQVEHRVDQRGRAPPGARNTYRWLQLPGTRGQRAIEGLAAGPQPARARDHGLGPGTCQVTIEA